MRHIIGRVLTALTAAAVMLLGGASRAWAIVAPEPTGGSSGSDVTVPGAGFEAWQVVSIAATCALLAVLATLLVSRIVASHRGTAPCPAAA